MTISDMGPARDRLASSPSRDRAGRRWWTGIAALSCVVIALVVVLVVEAVHGAGSNKKSDAADALALARSAAMQEAIDEAPVLFSYDYRKLDKDLAAARAVTTGAFTASYDQVSVPAVKPLAAKYQVVVVANVLGSSIVDDSGAAKTPSTVKVLLFLNQTVKNSQLAAPRVDANRTVLTMQKVGAGWKVAGVDAI
jgi:Mce-associated membrane protein